MSITDADVLVTAEQWKRAGRKVALATVVETTGSAPRLAGARLVVDGEGNFAGSVSGGCLEGDIVAESLEVIETGVARLLDFGVAEEVAWRGSLACGGHIKVYIEPIDG